MATKAKTRTRARTKAPAAEAPKPTPQSVAPEPAAVAMEGPGFRTPDVWSPRDRSPRPTGELTRTATLVRGISFTLSYSTGAIVLRHGKPTPINDTEFERLSEQVDRVDFPDPANNVRVERRIRKFVFNHAASGDAIELPVLEDRECGPFARTLGEQTEHDRKFEGQEFTQR